MVLKLSRCAATLRQKICTLLWVCNKGVEKHWRWTLNLTNHILVHGGTKPSKWTMSKKKILNQNLSTNSTKKRTDIYPRTWPHCQKGCFQKSWITKHTITYYLYLYYYYRLLVDLQTFFFFIFSVLTVISYKCNKHFLA